MKRFFAFIAAAAMLSLTACGAADSISDTETASQTEEETIAEEAIEWTEPPTEPATIMELPEHEGANVVKVVAGSTFTGALTDNGSLYMWGQNNQAQLGLGNTVLQKSPVKVMERIRVCIKMN